MSLTTKLRDDGTLPAIEWVPQVPAGEARELMPFEAAKWLAYFEQQAKKGEA